MGVDPWVDKGTCPPPTFCSGRDALCFVPLRFWEQTLFVKCPCNVIHDSVTLIFTFLIIIIIIMHSTDCRRSDSAKTVTRIIG